MKTQAVRTQNYREFYFLIKEMAAWDKVRTEQWWVSEFSRGHTINVREMYGDEFRLMIESMWQHIRTNNPEFVELSNKRRGVLKAIIAMFELEGHHPDDKFAFAKGIALKNRDFTDETVKKEGLEKLFNKITLKGLNDIYQWANRRQKTIENGNAAMLEEAMKIAMLN